MSNLWFNIRFGNYHLQMTNKFRITWTYNEFHINNPKRFEVYAVFGVYLK